MSLRINDVVPDFTAESTEGTINFHQWIGDGWAILFSHPKDFTPGVHDRARLHGAHQAGVRQAELQDPRHQRGRRQQPREVVEGHPVLAGHAVNYPLIGDPQLNVVKLFDMLPASAGDTSEGRTAADNATARSVFVIGPDKKIKAMLTYPMSTGRNFDEILRLLDSCRLTASKKVATPVNWKQGEDVIILPAVSDEDAKKTYPDGWKSPLPYIRIVPQPR